MIGINRDLADRPMGTRTLGLVALGAAAVAVATIQVAGVAENPDAMSRVVQGIIQEVMAGISFIGAGVILRDAQTGTVEGLTTAATVWVTAALGIACGLGRWDVGVIGTAIALLLLVAAPCTGLNGWARSLAVPRNAETLSSRSDQFHFASISRRRSNSVAFGPKWTFSEPRLPIRFYEYAP